MSFSETTREGVASFERLGAWLYDQCRHRAEAEDKWHFTAGVVAQCLGHFRCWLAYAERNRTDMAEREARWVDTRLAEAADEMRQLRRDAALAETADILRRDMDGLVEAARHDAETPKP